MVVLCRIGRTQGTPASQLVDVQIDVAGSQAAVSSMAETTVELLARLQIVPRIRAVGEVIDGGRRVDTPVSSRPLILAFIDLRSTSAPTVRVTEGTAHRLIVDRTLPASASLDLTVEEAAYIVYTVVDSLLRTEETRKADRKPSPTALPPPIAESDAPASGSELTRSPKPRLGLEAGLFLSANAFEGHAPSYGVGANVALGLRNVSPQPAVRLSATTYPTTHHEVAKVDAAVTSMSFRVVPTIEWLRTSTLSGLVGAGAGVDWFRVSPTPPPSYGQVKARPSNVDPVIATVVGARLRIVADLYFLLDLALDVDCAPRRYIAVANDNSVDLFAPARLRPSVAAGLLFAMANPTQVENAKQMGGTRRHP
jgi:hypothetical protein